MPAQLFEVHSLVPHVVCVRCATGPGSRTSSPAIAGSRRRTEPMQLKTIAVALFTLLLAAVAAGAPAVPQTGCAALYVTGNELWSISSGGEARLVAQDERGINMP